VATKEGCCFCFFSFAVIIYQAGWPDVFTIRAAKLILHSYASGYAASNVAIECVLSKTSSFYEGVAGRQNLVCNGRMNFLDLTGFSIRPDSQKRSPDQCITLTIHGSQYNAVKAHTVKMNKLP
jgi:hypothetical protein